MLFYNVQVSNLEKFQRIAGYLGSPHAAVFTLVQRPANDVCMLPLLQTL